MEGLLGHVLSSGDEPIKEKKGKIRQRKKLTLSMFAIAASADPTGIAGVSIAPSSCPKLRKGAKPLYPCTSYSLAMGYNQGQCPMRDTSTAGNAVLALKKGPGCGILAKLFIHMDTEKASFFVSVVFRDMFCSIGGHSSFQNHRATDEEEGIQDGGGAIHFCQMPQGVQAGVAPFHADLCP